MKRTGEELRIKFGLTNVKYVSFIRLLGSPHRIIVIFYDSRKGNVPLTTQRVLRANNLFTNQIYPFEEKLFYTPLLPLDEYNGPLIGTLFLTFDLSGTYGDSKNQVKNMRESQMILGRGVLREFVTLKDLKAPEAMSDFTRNTRAQRKQAMKDDGKGSDEQFYASLLECEVDEVDDSVTFKFLTEATEPIYPPNSKFKQTDPTKNFSLEGNPSKTYEIHIKILEFFTWLKGTRPDDDTSDISRQEIIDVLDVANIQVFSNDPSFHWQGINYFLSQIDGSIYPTNIAPKVWNAPHLHGDGQAFVTKHIAGVFNQIGFFEQQMASMLTKRLREKGLL